MTRQDLVDDAIALQELLSEHIENLRGLPEGTSVTDPLASTTVSGAVSPFRREEADLLPTGRLKHSPYQRMRASERRDFALETLSRCVAWFVPLQWAEQHWKEAGPDAMRYWRGIMQTECTALVNEGKVEVRSAGVRGCRYKYRLKEEFRVAVR